MIEEYVQHIPVKTTNQAFDVMRTHKRKLQRLTDYLAFQLHRRMANDPRNSERYQGMFVQLKMFDQLIGGRPDPEHENKVRPVQEEKIDYDAHITTASNFAAKARNAHNPQ